MNKHSLLFNNPIQEKQYRNYIKQERGKPLRIIVTLQAFNEFIMLSTVVYYYLADKNNFGDALDYILYQVIVFIANSIIAILMLYKLLDFGVSLFFFIFVHTLRVTLTLYMPGYFDHSLQFFSQFQYGYSVFLIIIVLTFSYHFLFKAATILTLNSVVFFLYQYEYNNFYTMSFISAVLCYKVFTDEKTFRQDFLIKQKMEKWMLIVDKVIPSSVFITKFNPREEQIELSQSNQKAKVKFDVKNSEQFQAFIARTFLDKNSEEIAQKNNLPPNNLKVKIRGMIEKERTNTQKKLYHRKITDGVQKLKTVADGNKLVAINYSTSNVFTDKNRNRVESKVSGRSDSLQQQQTPGSLAPSRKPSNPYNSNSQGNMNNIPLPFRNIMMKKKRIRDGEMLKNQLDNSFIQIQHNDSFHSLSQQQITNQIDNENLNSSYQSQPVQRKVRKAKTIRNRQQMFRNHANSNGSIQTPQHDSHQQNGNALLGYYRKDELSEQQTFSIKLYSYYLEEIYVIVVIDEESYEERMIREKNRLRDFQISSTRFVNELSLQARNMFSELRSQQICYLNSDQVTHNSDLMKNQNMRAINHCFGIINHIDNFIISNNYIPTAILESEIKEIDLNQLLDNLLKVLQLQKEERNLKFVIYNAYKKHLQSSSKYITQLLYNILNLSFQVCAENGLIQIEIKEINKSFYTSYIEFCIKHTLKEESFSIFNFCEQQKLVFETSKKLLELISPYSKFFIKQRKNFYAQIKFYIYKDLNEIHLFNKTRQTMYHSINGNGGNHLIEQEECLSDDLSIELTDPCINKIESMKNTNKNTRNLSRILSTNRQNTDNPIKLSQEYTEEDHVRLRNETLGNKSVQSKSQINQITSSVFVEGISGYKIPFGLLFAESNKEKQQQQQQQQQLQSQKEEELDYEDEDDEGDDDEEIQKTEQESSYTHQAESRKEKTYRSRLKKQQKNSMKRAGQENTLQSEEKKTDNQRSESVIQSKKRFSSHLDTRNTSQRSQMNIRSKKNSCFNENNNETQQLYFHERGISGGAIRESEEEMTLTKSNNSNTVGYHFSVNNNKSGFLVNDQDKQQIDDQFDSSRCKSPSISINTGIKSEKKDEIKEFFTESQRKMNTYTKSSFQSSPNGDQSKKILLQQY